MTTPEMGEGWVFLGCGCTDSPCPPRCPHPSHTRKGWNVPHIGTGRQCQHLLLLAATQSRCRGCLQGSVGRLQATRDEMVTEGPWLLSRKLFLSSWGAVFPAPCSAEPWLALALLEPGVTRAVCFPACYSLTPFSSQKSFASGNKKGSMGCMG